MSYEQIRKKLVLKILELSFKSKEGHVPSSLSVLDMLYSIYSNFITKDENHKFVLSKGHASLSLYVILNEFNILKDDLNTFCKFDSSLGGHPTDKTYGVEASTGSLGHGMPIAVGMALGKKIKNSSGKVITIIGDGEANEGTIWESALIAKHHNLNNLYCLLDNNLSTVRALDINDIAKKFTSFGWNSVEVDGHDINQITESLKTEHFNKPTFILCNTIKGKGCAVMENNPEWHHKTPTIEQYNAFINDIMHK
jgi:transketolase